MNKHLEQLLEKYPFLAVVRYGGEEFVCIIQNQDNDVTTIYDLGLIKNHDEMKEFLELGEIWWWESNRSIPINIFMSGEWKKFAFTSKSLVTKNAEILAGHCICLNNLSVKRTKRKSIQLVKKPNN